MFNMNRSQRNSWLIAFTILIIIGAFIPVTSNWYFPINLIVLIILYGCYYFQMMTRQFGWAIFEGIITMIWFDSYFKAPFGWSSQTVAIVFAVIGAILTIIALICEIRKKEDEK